MFLFVCDVMFASIFFIEQILPKPVHLICLSDAVPANVLFHRQTQRFSTSE